MKISAWGVNRSLRFSGILLILGLVVELTSLVWERPLAFLLFAFVGGALVALGVVVYLYSLVSRAH